MIRFVHSRAASGQRRALVTRTLCARRRVGAHLHELSRWIVAQPLAELGRMARVAHRVVEGEACLRAVTPGHRGVQDCAWNRTVGARCASAIGLTSGLEKGEAVLELAALAV